MGTLLCENGHRVGFCQEVEKDGWYTLRCFQCNGQPLVPMKCPFCANIGAHMWTHPDVEDIVRLKCAACEKEIDNKNYEKSVLRQSFRATVQAALVSLAIGVVAFVLGARQFVAVVIASVGFVVAMWINVRRELNARKNPRARRRWSGRK